MEKLGYGWDTLHERYPRLIYAAASGFGHTGPNSKYPAYDMVVQGMGGIMSITGIEGRRRRGSARRSAISPAAFSRRSPSTRRCCIASTGEATKVDVGMFDCQIALLENAVMRYTIDGEIPGPLGARHPSITPFQAFAPPTAPSSSPPAMTGFSSRLRGVRAPRSGEHPATRPTPCATSTTAARGRDRGGAEGTTTDHWIAVLEKAGLPCGPVNNVAQALAHPQIAARNMLIEVPTTRRDAEAGRQPA